MSDPSLNHDDPILSFRGEFYFLSNFYRWDVTGADGRVWPSAEHAFQACKTRDIAAQEQIRFLRTPGQAKAAGHHVALRPDWEDVKGDMMYRVVKAKFSQSQRLVAKLLATGVAYLVEGNTWGDRYWGQVNGEGVNMLGQILMRVRSELKES